MSDLQNLIAATDRAREILRENLGSCHREACPTCEDIGKGLQVLDEVLLIYMVSREEV